MCEINLYPLRGTITKHINVFPYFFPYEAPMRGQKKVKKGISDVKNGR